MHEHQVMRKLRALAVMAHSKIWTNRFKGGPNQPAPGKWPEIAFNESGERDWRKAPLSALLDKLDEEVLELRDECLRPKQSAKTLLALFKESADVAALAMFLSDWAEVWEAQPTAIEVQVPKIVCLCGSTKFKDEFMQANYEETMKGNIVLSVGFFMHADAATKPSLSVEEKRALDQLHFRKIDLSDEILVINVGGYVGESTVNEIEYSNRTGKVVRFRYQAELPGV